MGYALLQIPSPVKIRIVFLGHLHSWLGFATLFFSFPAKFKWPQNSLYIPTRSVFHLQGLISKNR